MEIEFRTSPDGSIYYIQNDDRERRFNKFDSDIINNIIDIVKRKYPSCYNKLMEIYNNNKYQAAERFIRCNLGNDDLLTHDIENSNIHIEEVKCPLRGICKDENIICKPKETFSLSCKEKEVASLYIDGYTFKEIASVMQRKPSTVKTELWRIKNKVGARNCREIIKFLK